jgi:hypothetical protein
MKLHRFLMTFYLPFFPIVIYMGLEKINKRLIKNSIIFISIIFLQIIYWFYVTLAGSEILDFSRNHEEVALFVTKDLEENSNILLLDDKPSHVYHIFQKIPPFSHHIDRLRHCEEVTNFSSYIEENNIIYIIKEKDHPRHFLELETFDKTTLGNFEVYKTNLVDFPERKICNRYCKVDVEFCSF